MKQTIKTRRRGQGTSALAFMSRGFNSGANEVYKDAAAQEAEEATPRAGERIQEFWCSECQEWHRASVLGGPVDDSISGAVDGAMRRWEQSELGRCDCGSTEGDPAVHAEACAYRRYMEETPLA